MRKAVGRKADKSTHLDKQALMSFANKQDVLTGREATH